MEKLCNEKKSHGRQGISAKFHAERKDYFQLSFKRKETQRI